MSEAGWIEANQHLLVAEFARLEAQLVGKDGDAETRITAARAAMPAPAAIDVLAAAFGLSAFERDVLLLCAGVEMDGAIAAACASHNASAQSHATFALALAKLGDPHWSALTPVSPLRHWRLLEVRDERALTGSRLSVDERILHYLAGVNYLEPRIRPLIRLSSKQGPLCERDEDAIESTLERIRAHAVAHAEMPIVYLSGDDPAGQSELARRLAAGLELGLHELQARDIPDDPREVAALTALWSREAVLLESALIVNADDGEEAAAESLCAFVTGNVFLAARRPIPALAGIHLTVNKPDVDEQKLLWKQALGKKASRVNGALDLIAGQFRLSADTILRTANALSERNATSRPLESQLWHACRDIARRRVDELAQRVEPRAGWPDLVLPDTQLATLRQIAARVRQRTKVYGEWGFAGQNPRGLGISVLFSGESGTGKTMAAEVLANELELDLYRIDLASMVSKYIGETEKNLRRVFDAAEDSGAILLFDEADALFGKRSEVKSSHDRYANIEVSYLLQRMEAYRGLAILTTNLKSSIDNAFLRRLAFVVSFPFPDQVLRERIWRTAFPAPTPLADVDARKLSQLNVSGGSIRNIALNAAFIAAEARAPLGMSHLLLAARSDATKRERPFSEAETRGWA
jgi:tRNA A37 threonylcarbamoyladenosine biosynthesis protein TsaE